MPIYKVNYSGSACVEADNPDDAMYDVLNDENIIFDEKRVTSFEEVDEI
jgi:hypothetical protein